MKKYYRVFISSVSEGFKSERRRIIDSLMSEDRYFPVAMEHMTAASDTCLNLFTHMRNSDIYLLLFGTNYGSFVGNGSESLKKLCNDEPLVKKAMDIYMQNANVNSMEYLTYTEIEFIFAMALNLPSLMFIEKEAQRICKEKSGNPILLRFYSQARQHSQYAVWDNADELESVIHTSLNNEINSDRISSTSGWIRETDSSIFRSAKVAGISDITLDGRMSAEEFEKHLLQSKTLKIFYTTGARLLQNYEELLAKFVSKGGEIKFICCKPHSAFLTEVQLIEETVGGLVDRSSIHNEFYGCFTALLHVLNLAKNRFRDYSGSDIGKIELAFTETLFRSSILICEKQNRQDSWGWLTLTLPPFKSKETVSFELIGCEETKRNENVLINRASNHFDSVWEISEKKGDVFQIDQNTVAPRFDDSQTGTGDFNKDYWLEKERTAKANMKRHKTFQNVLIEVAAQHPLDCGLYPSREFRKRLDRAFEIYQSNTDNGIGTEIYVPGSVHLDDEGIADFCSLSSAGCKYLSEKGVPESRLHGDDLNNREYEERYYSGVYNTADECLVASRFFESPKHEFGKLICVCSPNQLMRKTLFYLQFGVIAQVVTVPDDKLSHNFLYELLTAVPYVLNEDHDWQGENSKEAIRTRSQRDPEWAGNNSSAQEVD